MIRESRVIARLLLDGADDQTWRQAIVIDNALQKRSIESAKRQANMIKSRLTLVKPELWELIVSGSSGETVQALLAASIKHSRLLGDFMNRVVKSHWGEFQKRLTPRDWDDYLDLCAQLDPTVNAWTDSTRNKLKQIVFKILAEAGYIHSTASPELAPVSVEPAVKQYLIKHSEQYVLNCMEVTP